MDRYDDHRDVVPAALGERLLDELIAETLRRPVPVEEACDLRGVNHVRQSVGAQQDPVALLKLEVDDLRRDVAPGPDSLSDVPPPVPAGAAVIGGNLTQLARTHQVRAAVPHVTDPELAFVLGDVGEDGGGTHSAPRRVLLSAFEHCSVGCLQRLAQDLAHLVSFLKGLAGERRRDRVDCEPASDMARRVPAQAVSDGEDAMLLVDAEGVLVASPHMPDLGPGSYLHPILFL